MNKGDLINEVSVVMNSKKDAQTAIDAVLSTISSALKKGESVTLVGFGTFKVAERKAIAGLRLKNCLFPCFQYHFRFSPNRFQDSVDFQNLISFGISPPAPLCHNMLWQRGAGGASKAYISF